MSYRRRPRPFVENGNVCVAPCSHRVLTVKDHIRKLHCKFYSLTGKGSSNLPGPCFFFGKPKIRGRTLRKSDVFLDFSETMRSEHRVRYAMTHGGNGILCSAQKLIAPHTWYGLPDLSKFERAASSRNSRQIMTAAHAGARWGRGLPAPVITAPIFSAASRSGSSARCA